MIKYAVYEKIREGKSPGKGFIKNDPKKSPRLVKKNVLRQSLKKISDKDIKNVEPEISPIRKIRKEATRVIYKATASNKSYDIVAGNKEKKIITQSPPGTLLMPLKYFCA